MFKVSLAFRMVTVHRFGSSLSSRHMVPVEVMEESDKIHSDYFPIELKSKETQLKMVRMNFILPIKMAISHQVLSLGVI